MLERVAAVILILLAGALVYKGFSALLVNRARKRVIDDPLLQTLKPNTPAIVYFTTPMCIPCRTQQQPALARLEAEMGEAVQIIKVDATENPETADRWGVFSVPTTFILNGAGQPQQVNYGVADVTKLRHQLERVTVNL
ncbi:MAG: thioredoxin [Chloroflexi bacterium]|nr:MAG: hypothetical protein CUN54_05735 [Phototrophicales bacterium]RMF79246.1 MAG: thioredoxin [Chloroflexota bacterium]